MRRIIISAAVASLAVLSFSVPSQAADAARADKPTCFVKTIQAQSYYGLLVVKHIRVCE